MVVSAAAGAVGSLVGQIAKIKGCRVVGIAGGAEKCRTVIDEYGFDAAVDYKSSEGRARRCASSVPTVWACSSTTSAATCSRRRSATLARGARVVLCGAVSQYNEGPQQGPRNYMSLLVKRSRMEGFVVFDYAKRYGEAAAEIAGWIGAGKLRPREHIVDGLETFPESLLMLYRGENNGKLMLRVGE